MSHKNKNKILSSTFILLYFLFNSCSQPTSLTVPTSTLPPSPTIIVTPTPLLKDIEGLIYKLDNDLWIIDESGAQKFLFTLPKDAYTFDIQLSSNNSEIVYEHEGDIWHANLGTQERRNITNTPDRLEKVPQFWMGRRDIIIFESILIANYSAFELSRARGTPTIVNTNGANYKIIDEKGKGYILFSSDGTKILYRLSNDLIAIYVWETSQVEIIDTNLYQLPLGRDEGIFIQAWSPDERYLVGRIGGYLSFGEKFQLGIAIIDLQAKTSENLHLISPKAGGDIIHYLSWSPNGKWIVFTMHADPSYPDEFISLWVSNIDMSKKFHIDEGVNPIWHEDSQRLAYDRKAKALIDGIWVYDLKTDSKYKTALPDEALLVDWVSLIP